VVQALVRPKIQVFVPHPASSIVLASGATEGDEVRLRHRALLLLPVAAAARWARCVTCSQLCAGDAGAGASWAGVGNGTAAVAGNGATRGTRPTSAATTILLNMRAR
jgi:hypothetical protein